MSAGVSVGGLGQIEFKKMSSGLLEFQLLASLFKASEMRNDLQGKIYRSC